MVTVGSNRVGYFCSYFPRELLYAFGHLPYRVLPGDGEYAAAEAVLPRNFCALLKSTLSPFLKGEGPALGGVVILDSCDGYRRFHDVWRYFLKVPVLTFLDLPRRSDPAACEFYAQKLGVFVRYLEKEWSRPLTPRALSEAILVYNEQRRLFGELATARSSGLVSDDEYNAVRLLALQGDPRKANSTAKGLRDRALTQQPRSGGCRVMVMGSVVVKQSLVEAVLQGGARVVIEESCADTRDRIRPVRSNGTVGDMIADLAAAYLEKPPCPRMGRLTERIAFLREQIKEYRIDGLVCSYFKFCDTFLGEFPLLKAEMEREGIPVLLVEDEGDALLSGQVRTRLEAFLEVLT